MEEYSDTSFTVKKAGFYPASSLLVTKSMDEDGNTAYSFTEFSGKTLLERRVLSSDETADTYYVYDDFDDLRAVIPPMLSKEVSTSTSTHWTSNSEPLRGGRSFMSIKFQDTDAWPRRCREQAGISHFTTRPGTPF